MIGPINLALRLRNVYPEAESIVCVSLAAPEILSADFCDRCNKAIRSKLKLVLLNDSGTVLILCRSGKRTASQPTISNGSDFLFTDGRTSPLVRMARSIVVPPKPQMYVNARIVHNGLVVLEPITSTYKSHEIAAANGMIMGEPNLPFPILVANSGDAANHLKKNQKIGLVQPNPI